MLKKTYCFLGIKLKTSISPVKSKFILICQDGDKVANDDSLIPVTAYGFSIEEVRRTWAHNKGLPILFVIPFNDIK